MLQLPVNYRHYERSRLDKVYKALRNKDLSDCVILAAKVLKETDNFIEFKFKEKSTSKALEYGIEGKKAFCGGDYQIALMNYNMALMRAPPNSEAMRSIYCSRAELLLKTGQFRACVKDIETCLGLSCPDSLVKKLQEMKAEANQFTWIEPLVNKQMSTPFSEQFFKLKGHHPDIPCASSDIDVIMELGQPKVVATKDIPVGTVLAVETSFVGVTQALNNITSCHYCLKMTFNLIPCDGCCAALFCDKHCKDKAMQEGHNIECKLIEIILDDIKLPVKAVFKIRQLCSSWDEFIAASNDLCVKRIKNNSVAEIFGSHKFSLLNSHYDRHFIHGAMFNRCMYFANIIHYLETRTSFLPNSPADKSAAIRAVSRMFMHLSLYCTPVQMQHFTSEVLPEGRTTFHNHPNKGYFSLIGNLAHSCSSNSYVLAIRNSAALMTTMPIKKGTELTISYVGQWKEFTENMISIQARRLFVHFRTICKNCVICRNDNLLRNQPLNETEMRAFQKYSSYHSDAMKIFPQNIESHYKETCKILETLSEVPFSKEYVKAFASFVQCLLHVLQVKYPNVTMRLPGLKS